MIAHSNPLSESCSTAWTFRAGGGWQGVPLALVGGEGVGSRPDSLWPNQCCAFALLGPPAPCMRIRVGGQALRLCSSQQPPFRDQTWHRCAAHPVAWRCFFVVAGVAWAGGCGCPMALRVSWFSSSRAISEWQCRPASLPPTLVARTLPEADPLCALPLISTQPRPCLARVVVQCHSYYEGGGARDAR
jgi:hypothetical protein